MGEHVTIVPGKPDADLAADYKSQMESALTQVCNIVNDAKANGLIITYGTGDGPMGRHVISNLIIARHY